MSPQGLHYNLYNVQFAKINTNIQVSDLTRKLSRKKKEIWHLFYGFCIYLHKIKNIDAK